MENSRNKTNFYEYPEGFSVLFAENMYSSMLPFNYVHIKNMELC